MLASATRTGGGEAAAITTGAGGVGADTTGAGTAIGGATSRTAGVEDTSATIGAAAWLGGDQPGGGTKALLGSTGRADGATARGADGSAAAMTTGTGVGAVAGAGAAVATAGAAVWDGGIQPGGGTKALSGSPRRAGDGDVTTAGVGTRLAGWADAKTTGAAVTGETDGVGVSAAEAATGAAG